MKIAKGSTVDMFLNSDERTCTRCSAVLDPEDGPEGRCCDNCFSEQLLLERQEDYISSIREEEMARLRRIVEEIFCAGFCAGTGGLSCPESVLRDATDVLMTDGRVRALLEEE